MIRNAYINLEKWIKKTNRKPLIVWGARQVGKTYLIKDMFAEDKFKNNYIYVDFRKEADIREYCIKTVDPKEIMDYISLSKNKKITSETLLIFDEIQECPSIITSLKYFCQDYPMMPVIATGSMVRIKLHRINRSRGTKDNNSFLFPVGKINQMTLYPMTFDEFMINYNEGLYRAIVNSYEEKKAMPIELHNMAMDALYKYFLIGGMPEVLSTYLETNSYVDALEVLKDLYDNYLADMELYQASPESVVRSQNTFKNIYKELEKENKNFKVSLIEEKAKTRDYKSPIDWLTMAHIVNKSNLLNNHVTIPLMEENESLFRLFLGDMGMFSYQSGESATSFITKGSKNTLSGIFYENYIANELVARDIPLFYWKGKSHSELEFVVEKNNEIYVLDVKKTKGTLNSLEKYKEHNSFAKAYKISENNWGIDEEKKLYTVPLYAFFLIADELKK